MPFIKNASVTRKKTTSISTLNNLYSWGLNTNGQLGDNSTTSRSSPVFIVDGVRVSSAANNFSHFINGVELWAMGVNTSGQLGDGTATTRSSPVQIGTEQDFWDVVGGGSHTLILREGDINIYGNTLYAVGLNTNGQLGQGNTTIRSSPVQIGLNEDWTYIAAGSNSSYGIRHNGFDETGTLWSWGANALGQLGDGTTLPKSSPVQIGTGQYWLQVRSSNNHVLAIYRDIVDESYVYGLYAWGVNTNGQLGDSTTTAKSSPVLISSDWWLFVSTGANHSAGVKSDYTLWTWGLNTDGQLGDGTTTAKSSPVQIPGSWYYVTCLSNATIGVKFDLTIWAWGANTSGQLGLGDTTSRSSPVQIGSFGDWYGPADSYFSTPIDAGASHVLAVNYSQ